MLTPEYLESLDNSKVVELYNQLNIDICSDIVSRLVRTNNLTDYTRKQLEVLKRTNGDKIFSDTLIKSLELDTPVKEALMQIYKEVGQEDIDSYRKLYEYRDITPKLNNEQLGILNNAILKTSGELSNMTNTIAFSSQELYVNAVDRAYTQVVSGGIDYNTAIKNSVNDLVQKGITLKDSLGRNVKLSTAIRRNILTGVKQTADNINKNIDKQLGCDGYETTAHLGARETHQEWQGRQFATTPELAKEYGVELWENSNAKEELNDYNCRHTYFGIILGVSEPVYTKAELNMLNNDKIDVNGEKMSIEEAISKKNSIERKLENYTRSRNTLDSLQKQDKIQAVNELLKEYNEKINLWQQKYDSYSKIYNLGLNEAINKKTTREYVEKIDLKDLNKKIFEYEKSIDNSKVENAYVIENNGNVYKFVGDEVSVNIYGVNLENAVITHNHPIDGDVYRSFGSDDFTFLKNSLPSSTVLRVTTPDFYAIINKIKEIDISYNEIYKEALMKGYINQNIEVQHEAMEILKNKGYVNYEKKSKQ